MDLAGNKKGSITRVYLPADNSLSPLPNRL